MVLSNTLCCWLKSYLFDVGEKLEYLLVELDPNLSGEILDFSDLRGVDAI